MIGFAKAAPELNKKIGVKIKRGLVMKVCPFCQSKDLIMLNVPFSEKRYVKCNKCGGSGPIALDKAMAEKKWDYRPIPQRIEMGILKGESDNG